MERNTETGKLFTSLMRERSSVRQYDDRPIPDEILKDILETGINAASGGNLQPYSVIVIKDPERKNKLADMSWGQPHIRTAAVDLVFLMDWNKYHTYAAMKDAPFQANNIFSEIVVALEDMSLCAQTIEMAAHMYGIGSCYIASLIDAGEAARELLGNPKYTYPILAMTLGYPKGEEAPRRKHMKPEGMIFDERYPEWSEQDIYELFEDKFEGLSFKLPSKEESRAKRLHQMEKALQTSYAPDEVARIMAEIEAAGFVNEAQRCFGWFYNADNMIKLSEILVKDMEQMGITLK